MEGSIRGSFIIQRIRLFFGAFPHFAVRCRSVYGHSILGRIGKAFSIAYPYSATGSRFENFLRREDPAATSAPGRFFARAEEIPRREGGLSESSLFSRFSAKAFELGTGEGGIPLRRVFIFIFSLYLPIEYIIRNIIKINMLSSVWEEAFIILGFAVVFAKWLAGREGSLARYTSVEAYMFLFICVGFLLSNIIAPFPAVAMLGLRAQVQYMLWFMIMIRLLEDEADLKVLFFSFAAFVLLMSFHGIYQYIIGVENPESWTTKTEIGVRTRVFSLTGSPNILGSIIVMAAPIAASGMYYLKKPVLKFLSLAATGTMCLCILFTFSRGSWVGLSAAVVVFALLVDRRLLALLGAAVGGLIVAVPSIASRLAYLFTSDYAEASAIGGRSLRWSLGMTLLKENSPWLGFGLGRFGGAVAMNNQILDKTEEFSYFYMDNYYLKTLVEMGYIGLIFFLILIFALCIYGFKSVHRSGFGYTAEEGAADALFINTGNFKIISAGVFSGLMGVLVHCYFENIFEEPYMMAYFWALAAGLIYSGYFIERKGGNRLEKEKF